HNRALPSFPTRRSSDLTPSASERQTRAEVHARRAADAVRNGDVRAHERRGHPHASADSVLDRLIAEPLAFVVHRSGIDESADARSEEHTSELQSPYDLV